MLDCAKAKKQLAWEPVLSFDETLQLTVDWYKKFKNSSDKNYKFTEMQIGDYLNKRNSLCNVGCRAKLEQAFLNLGLHPLSNAFVKMENKDQGEMFYPLEVYA